MPKHLFKQNGKWWDRSNENSEFKGKVVTDLAMFDRYERQNEDGQNEIMEVVKKEGTSETGITVILKSVVM
jgi:hypothetical protein